VSNEAEVQSKMNSLVSCADGIVLVEFGFSDVDRLTSFFHIVKKNGRCLAVSLKQAYLLDALCKDKGLAVLDLNDPNMLIFRESKKSNYNWESQLIKRFEGQRKVFDVFEASKQQCNIVLAILFLILRNLWL
jgi:mRNA degradation ribonuclease J1/J2